MNESVFVIGMEMGIRYIKSPLGSSNKFSFEQIGILLESTSDLFHYQCFQEY